MVENLNKWMSNIDSTADLFSLNIPGTHDCVTQYVQFSHISRCQDKNIYQQLSMGIRALDIRVQSKGEKLGMVHGIAKAYNTENRESGQMELGDVLIHCYRFLDENPSESIIFQFKNDSAKEQEKCFSNLFYEYIAKNREFWYVKNKIPTLGEARGKIVLLRRCNMDKSNKDFTCDNTGIDFSRWVEQDTAVAEPLTLKTYSDDDAVFVVQDRFKYKPVPRWNECILPFLNNRKPFDGVYVICYLSTAGGFKGPFRNSKYINPQFMNYKLDKNLYYGTVYLDFPNTQLTSKIIETNFKN